MKLSTFFVFAAIAAGTQAISLSTIAQGSAMIVIAPSCGPASKLCSVRWGPGQDVVIEWLNAPPGNVSIVMQSLSDLQSRGTTIASSINGRNLNDQCRKVAGASCGKFLWKVPNTIRNSSYIVTVQSAAKKAAKAVSPTVIVSKLVPTTKSFTTSTSSTSIKKPTLSLSKSLGASLSGTKVGTASVGVTVSVSASGKGIPKPTVSPPRNSVTGASTTSTRKLSSILQSLSSRPFPSGSLGLSSLTSLKPTFTSKSLSLPSPSPTDDAGSDDSSGSSDVGSGDGSSGSDSGTDSGEGSDEGGDKGNDEGSDEGDDDTDDDTGSTNGPGPVMSSSSSSASTRTLRASASASVSVSASVSASAQRN